MPDPRSFDRTALLGRVPATAARAEHGAHSVGRATVGAVFRTTVLVLGAGGLAAVFVVVVQYLFGAVEWQPSTVVIAAIMVLPLAIAQVRGAVRGRGEAYERWYRLTRFAAANGLDYTLVVPKPERSAAIFHTGSAAVSNDVVAGRGTRPFEAANFSFETWSAHTRMPHDAAYVAFTLHRELPPITLVTRTGVGRASWQPPRGQHVVDLDAAGGRFTASCPPGAEAAVRDLLSPAVCTALTDVAGQVDVEIVGGQVFFVARRALRTQDPAFWEWVEDLRALVDDHLDPQPGEEPTGAADPGRLRRRAELFRAPKAGRQFLIGCLLPLAFGFVAAAVSAGWG